MSYRPTAAGHGAREAPRTIVQDTIDERILKAARKWIDSDQTYGSAFQLTEEITPSVADANALPTIDLFRKHYKLGIFISALWNRCPNTTIIYSHDTPDIAYLGFALYRHKTLIIHGMAGGGAGITAEGPIIIPGSVKERAGVVERVIWVRMKNTFTFRGDSITPQDNNRSAECRNHIAALLALAKDDPLAVERTYGDGIKITEDIERLVGGGQ